MVHRTLEVLFEAICYVRGLQRSERAQSPLMIPDSEFAKFKLKFFKTKDLFSRVHVTLHPALSIHPSVGQLFYRSVTLLLF